MRATSIERQASTIPERGGAGLEPSPFELCATSTSPEATRRSYHLLATDFLEGTRGRAGFHAQGHAPSSDRRSTRRMLATDPVVRVVRPAGEGP
jgi:hypothetical protein